MTCRTLFEISLAIGSPPDRGSNKHEAKGNMLPSTLGAWGWLALARNFALVDVSIHIASWVVSFQDALAV